MEHLKALMRQVVPIAQPKSRGVCQQNVNPLAPAFLGMVGQDSFGTLLRDVLQEVGIETKGLKVSKDINTTLAFVHTKPDGDREFSFYRNPGADMMLSEKDLDMEILENCKIFHAIPLSKSCSPVNHCNSLSDIFSTWQCSIP